MITEMLNTTDLGSYDTWPLRLRMAYNSNKAYDWRSEYVNVSSHQDDDGGQNSLTEVDGDKPWNLLRQSTPMVIILTLAYLIVFTLSIINNSLVVAAIYRNIRLRTVTNYFIANLAIADIMVSILVLPITLLSNLFEEWWFGQLLCKGAPYLQGVAVSASVNTLAAVAVERYLAIFYPKTSRLSPQFALIIISFIWVLALCIFIPWPLVYTERTVPIRMPPRVYEYVTCMAIWKDSTMQRGYILGVVFLSCYLIPLVFIAIFYLLIGVRVWKRRVTGIRGTRTERNIHRSKIRIVRMLLAVFVIFALSWLPLYSLNMRAMFGSNPSSQEKVVLRRYITPLAQWLGAANSCVNPFIYCYFSANFRKSIIAVLRSRTCCSRIDV